METTDGGKWGQNIALYIIAGVILVALFIWLCHKSGEDKANLAGAVQKLYGRVDAIEPAVTANANNIYRINNTQAQIKQAVQDTRDDVADLDNAVFTSRCGCNRGGCGCGSSSFEKRSNYTLDSTTVTEIDTCKS
jgi:outer membrane murein-binding lipoprotein Lpp